VLLAKRLAREANYLAGKALSTAFGSNTLAALVQRLASHSYRYSAGVRRLGGKPESFAGQPIC
jgi:hypothetical protein